MEKLLSFFAMRNWFYQQIAVVPFLYTCLRSTCPLPQSLTHLIFNCLLPLFTHNTTAITTDSFDYGGVHFVSLDTETDFPDAAENEKGDSGIFDAGHFAPDGE
jgi:hypothetical protein